MLIFEPYKGWIDYLRIHRCFGMGRKNIFLANKFYRFKPMSNILKPFTKIYFFTNHTFYTPQLLEEQFYQNVDPNLPPPPIPGKKKSSKIEDKRPVAAPRRKTERAPATTTATPAPIVTTPAPIVTTPAPTVITPAPTVATPAAGVNTAPDSTANPMPQPIPRRKATNEPSSVIDAGMYMTSLY